jgi:hypothetical protein
MRSSKMQLWIGCRRTARRFNTQCNSLASDLLAHLSPDGRSGLLAYLQPRKQSMHVTDQDVTDKMAGHIGHGKPHLVKAAFRPSQMPGGVTLHYSTYVDQWFSTNSSGKGTFNAELDVSGNTTCQVGQICYEGSHQPLATLTIGSYGGTAYGASGYPANFIQAFETVAIPMDGWSGAWNGSDEGQIHCSFINSFIYTDEPLAALWFQIELSFTLAQDTGGPDLQPPAPCPFDKTSTCRTYPIVHYCSLRSSPPDWTPEEAIAPYRWPYQLGVTACFRVANIKGEPWICLAKAVEIAGNPDNLLAFTSLAVPWIQMNYDCTNYDAGFTGWPVPGIGIPPWPF